MMKISVDAKGCLTEWSDDVEKLTGFLRREVLGMPLLELVTFPFRGLVDDMMAMARIAAVGQSVHLPFFDKAGASVDIILGATSCEKETGHLALECTLLEEEVNEDAQCSHEVEVTSPGAVMSLDAWGCVADWNAEAEEATLFRREEVMGMWFLDLITVPFHESVDRMLRRARSGEAVEPVELVFYTKAAAELNVVLTARSVEDKVVVEGKFGERACDDAAPEPSVSVKKGMPSIWDCDTCDSLMEARYCL
eukprot:TRINITY_DN8102_c1_g2_i1.p1 TRINITY_DN8102_c1_g2~~TRINITY_DN8102_c1_g2_i1.p1  ORF type:complete len:273 (+),score=59.40 TRINITY_DN8102_c1_g2_i1:69-821(+)